MYEGRDAFGGHAGDPAIEIRKGDAGKSRGHHHEERVTCRFKTRGILGYLGEEIDGKAYPVYQASQAREKVVAEEARLVEDGAKGNHEEDRCERIDYVLHWKNCIQRAEEVNTKGREGKYQNDKSRKETRREP